MKYNLKLNIKAHSIGLEKNREINFKTSRYLHVIIYTVFSSISHSPKFSDIQVSRLVESKRNMVG